MSRSHAVRALAPAGRRWIGSAPAQPTMRKTFAALVVNEPGVLSRISGFFSSRGFNIDSLVVVRAAAAPRAPVLRAGVHAPAPSVRTAYW